MLGRLTIVTLIGVVCGCSERSEQSKSKPKDEAMDRPFMEHPSEEFQTAVDAMADAIKRLRALPKWDKWITFSAQGMGGREDSYFFAEIRMRQGEIAFKSSPQVGRPVETVDLDVQLVRKRAGVPESCFSKTDGGYSVAKATPIQAARLMDVIFRDYLGIRPHSGEGGDYAVGAEW